MTPPQRLFGEIITIALFAIPIAVVSIVQWLKNKRRDEKHGKVVIIRKTTFKEIGLLTLSQVVMGVGYFFLLRAFNTQFLILSTVMLSVSVVGNILYLRRSLYGPIFYVLYDVIALVVWTLIFLNGYTGAIVLIALQVLLIISDTYGTINWKKLYKRQILNIDKLP